MAMIMPVPECDEVRRCRDDRAVPEGRFRRVSAPSAAAQRQNSRRLKLDPQPGEATAIAQSTLIAGPLSFVPTRRGLLPPDEGVRR
jgi:hypothetical protein